MNENLKGWNVWFDGVINLNFGCCGIGGLLIGLNGECIEILCDIGYGINNEVEYVVFMVVFDVVIDVGIQDLMVYGDSQLVIKQVSGEWLINVKSLVLMCQMVIVLKKEIVNVNIFWIFCEENGEVDVLLKKVIGILGDGLVDLIIWMILMEIGKVFGLLGVVMGKWMDLVKLCVGGKFI